MPSEYVIIYNVEICCPRPGQSVIFGAERLIMFLKVITGDIGSGKSRRLYEIMMQNKNADEQSRAAVIVPEQFSYTAEKTLTAEIGGLGINNIEVTTFSRLVSLYINCEKNVLPSGRMMLICKALDGLNLDNIYYSGRNMPGLINKISELFSEFKRYGILPEDLSDMSCGSKAFQKKLSSINEIYEKYLGQVSEDFTDSDDNMTRLAELISSGGIFKNTYFYIDNYDNFMPQHFKIIQALLLNSRGVYITLGMPENTAGLFEPVQQTKNRLFAIAHNAGVPCGSISLTEKPDYIKSSDIRYLLANWESGKKYADSCENIEIFTARDIYSESEHTAAKIISLVRDKKMRFRDISIVCGDLSGYLHIITSVFADYGIPFFTDEKINVTMHPIVKTVLSLFDVIQENWSYNSVFTYLRSGYVYDKDETGISPVDLEDIDLLDTYVTAHGIKGKKAWFSEWTESGETIFDDVIENRNTEEYDLEKLNSLRKKIIAPFAAFMENKGRTASAIASAVYDFMCRINLYEGIVYECGKLDGLGMRNESQQIKQIWNTISEVLNQLVITMGKGSISRENFALYFKSGLSACELSIIPPGLDRVSLGTVSRNSPSRVRALFIIGCSYGAIPASSSGQSLLTPLDRSLLGSSLEKKNKELAPDDAGSNALERLKLYGIVSTAQEKLYISFPASDTEGNAVAPSTFIADVKNIFPDVKCSDNVISKPSAEELLSSQKRGFYYMLSKLSESSREKPEKLWSRVYELYSLIPEYSGKLRLLDQAAAYKHIQPKLSRQKAEMLYGKNKKYSITSLEKYSQCPFAYYLEKGLYAAPVKTGRIQKSHIGSLIHAAVCEYCTRVEQDAASPQELREKWEKLTPKASSAIVQDIIADVRKKITARSGGESKQIEYLLNRCSTTLIKSAENIRKSIISGGYTSVCREKDFEVRINWKNDSVTLFGKIDRVDVMELAADGKANIRVVDYKSGSKKFSLTAICNRLDMQLVLYALAAARLYEDGLLYKHGPMYTPQISGIFYNRLTDEQVIIPENDASLARREQNKTRRLDGIIVLDEAPDGTLPPDSICDMDKNFAENKSSEFLNVSLKADKTLSQASQVTSRSTFNTIAEYMKKSVIDTDRRIKDGDISINPYKTNIKTACNFCNFKEVCLFDAKYDKYRCLINDSREAIDYMKKEVAEDEKLD